MSYEKTDEVRVIVAFGDISGFTHTYERVTSPKQEIAPFFDRFDTLVERSGRDTGFPFIDTGDGFMCLVNLGSGHNCSAALRLLGSLWRLINEINDEIRKMQPPKFNGFRVRVAAGYVLRKVKRDGKLVHRGKPINLAHNLLQIAKDSPLVCHESFIELMSERQIKNAGFNIRAVPKPKRRQESVSAEDLSMLYILEKGKTK